MQTDRPPRERTLRAEFQKSDTLVTLNVPDDDRLRHVAKSIEQALAADNSKALRSASTQFLGSAANFYAVPVPDVQLLAARPIRVWESGDGHTELFGDYNIETALIRMWMRTAVQKRPTSFGTFLSALSHEFAIISISRGMDSTTRPYPRLLRTRSGSLPPCSWEATATTRLGPGVG